MARTTVSTKQETRPKLTQLPEYDFENSVGYWAILGAQAYQKALNNELAPFGITFRQSQVLGWLALETSLSQADLAARMLIEPPTLVGVLDRMERDGLIRRECSSIDRRRKMISATPAAAAVWQQVTDCARAVRARATAGMSDSQASQLMKSLRLMIHNLDSN